ncbi:MAG: hypothetical protein HGA96_15295 [Desulfobulbaceae bacterium]|nr:hypothetical protein [Desulfobulbaceae bacterium]
MFKADRSRSLDTYEHIEQEEEFLGGYLAGLQKVKGYKASAIMTYKGELLACHTLDSQIDLSAVGKVFNDIFRTAHDVSEKIGLQACLEIVINTPRGIVVMHCSGIDALIHFHLLVVMAADGNLALCKMELGKMTGPIMRGLS